jgi:outer membrane lipoprotein SlyB
MWKLIKVSLAVGMILMPGLIVSLGADAVAQSRETRSLYCERFARDFAERNYRGGTLQGASRGAAAGAVIGAIAGNSGRGAAIGSATGAIGGSIRREESRESLFRQAYDDCMRGW